MFVLSGREHAAALLTRTYTTPYTGALPDQLEFSRDCTTILVSNEGEPSTYTPASLDNDPEGSVSVINLFFCDSNRGEGPYAYASEAAALEGQYNEASTASGYGRGDGRPSQ